MKKCVDQKIIEAEREIYWVWREKAREKLESAEARLKILVETGVEVMKEHLGKRVKRKKYREPCGNWENTCFNIISTVKRRINSKTQGKLQKRVKKQVRKSVSLAKNAIFQVIQAALHNTISQLPASPSKNSKKAPKK